MERCTKCGMPDTRPGSKFTDGVCQACINYEKRKDIDWGERQLQLYEKLEGKRVLVAVSGGKDSHWIIDKMSDYNVLGADTICVHDCFTPSQAGDHNLNNLRRWRCDCRIHIDWQPDRDKFIKHTRSDFEKYGEPLRWIEKMIYKIPMDYKVALNYTYVIFGEDSSIEYGGDNTIPEADVLYMSHYYPWDDIEHLITAKKMGFHSLNEYYDWPREHWPDAYSQIDSIAYPVHLWLKYPKFGFQRVQDVASRRVRAGHWTKEKADTMVAEHDRHIDPDALRDFCKCLDYEVEEFWNIVMKADWNKYYGKKL